ncbi:MAG: retron St85 family RNA-directed DNA polymerase [Rhodospirillaceae bacterium]|nr:retron St85 family RNA-directed DNA polymerase [Rhodospirillaceae bacterium]
MLIESLQSQSGLSRSQLLYLADTASERYKIYTIAKRGGGRRRIAHPSRALKAVQRWISKVLILKFPVHGCATAYKKGASIRNNANLHVNSLFTLRMDFRNFFPSFREEGICRYLQTMNVSMNLALSEEDISFVCSVVTRNEALTIGAPTSPAITNAIMFEFDSAVNAFAQARNLVFTRYADDVFISSRRPDGLNGVFEEVVRQARLLEFVRLSINRKKTAYLSRRNRRSITGLIVTPDGKVSIGRNRKREIKSLIHRRLSGEAEMEDLERIRGLLAFAWNVEPDFFRSLQVKYGRDNLRYILGQPIS